MKRKEQSLGEIFSFFILETILLGRALKVNPFDQPSVELIKKQTKNMKVDRNQWKSMKFNEDQWNSLKIDEPQWN